MNAVQIGALVALLLLFAGVIYVSGEQPPLPYLSIQRIRSGLERSSGPRRPRRRCEGFSKRVTKFG